MNPTSNLRHAIGQVDLWMRDTYDQLLAKRQPMVPPRRLMYDGPQDPDIFIKNGQEFLRYYIDLCQLQPAESVVEIGSGMGRKAIPLTTYLDAEGSYRGYEINQVGVDWCRQAITRQFPNFRFEHIDVFNGRYNPNGSNPASDYSFPTADGEADFIVLASVFTHMFLDDVSHYLTEIGRMLTPGKGRCLISYFVLNAEVQERIAAGTSALTFRHQRDGCYVERPERPEDAVAYSEETLTDLYAQSGLAIKAIYPGAWCGREKALSYQDLIVAENSGSGS